MTRAFRFHSLSIGTLLLTLRAFSETVTLIPSADTTIFEQFPNRNLGAVPNFIVGGIAHNDTESGIRARALVKFDLAQSLPTNALITSAALRLKVEAIPPDPRVDGNAELHRLLTPWGEGNKTDFKGERATANEATWLNRFTGAPGGGWSVPGGSAPVDFAAEPSSSVFIAEDFFYTFPSSSNLVADVQFWLDHPAANFGWIIINQSESSPRSARRFSSKDDLANPNNRPQLLIGFTIPAAETAPRFNQIERTTNGVLFTVVGEAGKTYRVEASEAVPALNWVTVTNLTGAGPGYTVSESFSSPRRFYRIVRP